MLEQALDACWKNRVHILLSPSTLMVRTANLLRTIWSAFPGQLRKSQGLQDKMRTVRLLLSSPDSPARSAAAREGPLSASISLNRTCTSASLVAASSLASSNRLSSPSFSSSANFALRRASSFSRWSLQTSAFSTEPRAVVSSPTIYLRSMLRQKKAAQH